MNINDIYPSKYLKASDLQGRNVTVIIDRIIFEDLGDERNPDRKPILYFQGKQKGIVLNKTNGNTIANSYGPETDNWIGAEIILFEAMVDFQGKSTAAIRVKIPPRKVARPAAPPIEVRQPTEAELDDSIPF